MLFFFKQKTAYERRISDWSSDVCSSDLALADPDDRPATRQGQHQEVVRIGGVDAPLLMRRDEVQDHLRIAVVAFLHDGVDGPGVDRRLVEAEALAEDRKSTRLNSSH